MCSKARLRVCSEGQLRACSVARQPSSARARRRRGRVRECGSGALGCASVLGVSAGLASGSAAIGVGGAGGAGGAAGWAASLIGGIRIKGPGVFPLPWRRCRVPARCARGIAVEFPRLAARWSATLVVLRAHGCAAPCIASFATAPRSRAAARSERLGQRVSPADLRQAGSPGSILPLWSAVATRHGSPAKIRNNERSGASAAGATRWQGRYRARFAHAALAIIRLPCIFCQSRHVSSPCGMVVPFSRSGWPGRNRASH